MYICKQRQRRIFEAVVFDFDGTLVNSNQIKHETFFEVASEIRFGQKAMELVFDSVIGDRNKIFEIWAEQLGLSPTQGQYYESKYTKLVDQRVINAPEIYFASDLLSLLKKNKVKIFISSATPQKNLRNIINKRGWLEFFDGVFGGPTNKIDILKKQIIPRITNSSAIVVVGDGLDDQKSAEAIGCKFLLVGQDENKGLTERHKSYSLKETREILIGDYCER